MKIVAFLLDEYRSLIVASVTVAALYTVAILVSLERENQGFIRILIGSGIAFSLFPLVFAALDYWSVVRPEMVPVFRKEQEILGCLREVAQYQNRDTFAGLVENLRALAHDDEYVTGLLKRADLL